jgi:putative ABC transport system substrate-binding protein
MRRREFIAGLGAAAWPAMGRAQPATRLRLMGFLDDPEGQIRLAAIQEELARLGWVEGQNIRIDVRWGAGDPGLTQAYAAELVRLGPDVIIANSSVGVSALLTETRAVPIIFIGIPDPVSQGFVTTLARPGGNATGFSLSDSPMVTKWVQLLAEIAPRVSRVTLVFNPNSVPGGEVTYGTPLLAAADSLQIEPHVDLVRTTDDLEKSFLAAAREPGGGMIVPPDLFTIAHHQLTIQMASDKQLPAVYGLSLFATAGGLAAYGSDAVDPHRRAVPYVDRILRGEHPAALPVQAPTKFELVINQKTAKALGLTIAETLLATADEVIQ